MQRYIGGVFKNEFIANFLILKSALKYSCA